MVWRNRSCPKRNIPGATGRTNESRRSQRDVSPAVPPARRPVTRRSMSMPKTDASCTRNDRGENPSSRVVTRASTASGISSRTPLSLAAISSTTKRALPWARSSRSVIIAASIALPAGVARARVAASVLFSGCRSTLAVPLTETSGPWLVADSNQGRCSASSTSVPKRSSEASSAHWVSSSTINCGAVIVAREEGRHRLVGPGPAERRHDLIALAGRCDIGGKGSGNQGQPRRQFRGGAAHQISQRLAHLGSGKVRSHAQRPPEQRFHDPVGLGLGEGLTRPAGDPHTHALADQAQLGSELVFPVPTEPTISTTLPLPAVAPRAC